MSDQYQIVSVISAALCEALAQSSAAPPGRAQLSQLHEQALPLAKAVVGALDKAGLEIVPKAEGG